ncbi:MAG: hypothetical protein CL947_04800 [Epsilonproteobacteria bacterium]|nr:hypothetical protein [Campylobacterota bacterium]|tara:strand:- start:1412 stop:1870 length:459 start_codon:yes stop_codon:yes gene_type:complete
MNFLQKLLVSMLFFVQLQVQGYFQHTGQNVSDIIEISADDLKSQMEHKSDVYVINVLNKTSFNDCHITGSIHVPVDQLKKYARKKLQNGTWSKDSNIIIYCASNECPLSNHGYKLLRKLGFTNVQAYEGGMRNWYQKGYPHQGKCKAGYLRG